METNRENPSLTCAVAASSVVWYTQVMPNLLRSIFRWFRRPVAGQSAITIEEVLNLPYEPNMVGTLLERMEQSRTEHLDWADRLDRKLLAVMSADGVYAAILASIRNSLPRFIVVPLVLIVAVSLILAYLAWRPHPYRSVHLDFRLWINIQPEHLRRTLIVAHSGINHDMGKINRWKAKKLTWSSGFFVAALVTLFVYAVGI